MNIQIIIIIILILALQGFVITKIYLKSRLVETHKDYYWRNFNEIFKYIALSMALLLIVDLILL